jgi:glycosyltransferase involved in cell wall biosynthesis
MDRVGLVAPLPPQIGGVASVAEWLLSHEKEIGVTFDPFDLKPSRGKRLALIHQARQLARFARWARTSPSVTHACVSTTVTGLPRDTVLILLLRLKGRQVVAHVHGPNLPPGRRPIGRTILLRLVGLLSSQCVALSPRSMEMLAACGARTTWIPNPIRLSPQGEPKRNRSQALHLLLVGTYSSEKGCLELVEALACAREAGVDARLTIVGRDGRRGDEQVLRDRVSVLGVSEVVTLAGPVARDKLPAYYEAADVIALPSRAEGVPMALLEGMSFGLPVLASHVGGIPDVVEDGSSGFLVAPGDVKSLTDRVVALADPRVRDELGKAARIRAHALANVCEIASQWRAVYQRARQVA